MSKPELQPYKHYGMPDRYILLFGEDKGCRVFGKHQIDTANFEDRFDDRLILTSAIARYALYDIRPFPGRQTDEIAEDILNDIHPFNLLFSSDGRTLSQSTHEDTVRATAGRKYAQELREGDIRAFGPLSDGIPTMAAIALVDDMRSTLEEL